MCAPSLSKSLIISIAGDFRISSVFCLKAIKEHLTKGSIIGFDELNLHDFPGETLALKEVFGLDRYRIIRSPYSSVQSYIVIEWIEWGIRNIEKLLRDEIKQPIRWENFKWFPKNAKNY